MSNRRNLDQPTDDAIPAALRAQVERMNAWQAALGYTAPGFAHFRTQVVDAMHDGKVEKAVEIWTVTRNGTHVVTVPPDMADELAELLTQASRDARSGLEIVR